MLAQARAADPPRYAVPLLATAQTPAHMAETERVRATRLALMQDAMLAEQQRPQRGQGRG
jgi:hypothetical protein